MLLRVSPTLSLPPDAVTSTFALLAVRGAGKSNAGAAMAEEMFKAGLPFVAIDPVGSWRGLRSGRDGGPAGGLPVPIFGGKSGDVPLERGSGQLVADLIVEKRLSCVVDLSNFGSEGDKKGFLLAFAQRLYQKNEDPLHLFLEEADDYIPQKPMRDEAQLLRAWENIVRRGRSRGLGMTLITQRSAAIAKMVLTQVETLFVLRTTGPQDIAAIEAWVKYHQVDQKLLASLAGLEDGEAWVWSPHYLKKFERFRFRMRETFDSGATPKNLRGKDARKMATLADVDLSAIRGQMAATIEKAKADDPKALRARIAELEKRPTTSTTVEVPVFDADRVYGIEVDVGNVKAEIAAFGERIKTELGALCARMKDYRVAMGARAKSPPARGSAAPNGAQVKPGNAPGLRDTRRSASPATSAKRDGGRDRTSLGTGERAILTVIGQTDKGATREQLSVLTGYKRSSRDTYMQRLSSAQLIYQSGGLYFASGKGFDALGSDFEPLPTGKALREHWLQRLPEGERRIFALVVDSYPDWLARDIIDEKTGYKRSSRDTYLQRLGSRRLIETSRDGVRASEDLF